MNALRRIIHKKDNNLILLYKNLLYYKRDNNNTISISRFVLTIILVKMKRLCVPLSAMLKDSLTMEEHIAVTLITYGFTLSQGFVCNQSATEVAPLSTLSRSY